MAGTLEIQEPLKIETAALALKDYLKAAPKHEIESIITACRGELGERYPRREEAKYGKLARHMDEKQLTAFFSAFPPTMVRERFFFFTCLTYGLRCGEALKIQTQDVDTETGVIAIHSEKKTPGRLDYLPIPVSWLVDYDWYVEKLQMFINTSDGYLFYSDLSGHKHWCASYLRRIFRMICEFPQCASAGLNKTYGLTRDGRKANLYTVHSLRHSAGKRFCDLHGIRKAAEWLRHSDLNSTAIYTKPGIEEMRTSANATWDSRFAYIK